MPSHVCHIQNLLYLFLMVCTLCFGIIGSFFSPVFPVVAIATLSLSLFVNVCRLVAEFCFSGTGARYHVIREEPTRDELSEAVELQRAVLASAQVSPGRALAMRRVLEALEEGRSLDGDDFDSLLELDTLWGDESRPNAHQRGLFPHELSSLPTKTFASLEFREGGGKVEACSETCSICLESYVKGQLLRTLPCLHSFHSDCVDQWLKKSGVCPDCRQFSGVTLTQMEFP